QAARAIAPALQLNFTGELLSATILPTSGYALVGSPVDQSGLLVHALGYPVSDDDHIYQFDVPSQSYVSQTYQDGQWDSGREPTLSVGEGFFLFRGRAS